MFCSHCGTKISENSNICYRCGHPVESGSQGSAVDREAATLRWCVPLGRSGWAIAAGYLGLLSFIPFVGVMAIICGFLGLLSIAKDPQKLGKGRAWFGVISGAGFTILYLIIFMTASDKAIDEQVDPDRYVMIRAGEVTANAQRWYGYRTSTKLTVENVAKLIAEATKARDDRYAQADDLSQVRKGAALLRGPDVDEDGKSKEDRYRDTVRSNADKDFDKRIGYLLANTDASNKFMEQKRAELYSVMYGRDYAKGGSEAGEQGLADYQEFNMAWGELSDKERLLYDVGAAKQRMADAADAEYNRRKAEAAAQSGQGIRRKR